MCLHTANRYKDAHVCNLSKNMMYSVNIYTCHTHLAIVY